VTIAILLLSGGVAKAQTTLSSVIVTGTQPGSGSGGGGGGGYGGASTTGDQEANIPDGYCEKLAAEKPAECPSQIPFPAGPTYAFDKLPAGTAIPKAVAFMNSSIALPAARDRVAQALSVQTRDMASYWISRTSINNAFANEIRLACETQHAWDQLHPFLGVVPIAATAQCVDLYDRILAEASGTDFSTLFKNWLDLNGIDLTDLPFIGSTLVNQLSLQNSLARKHEIVDKDYKCADWWQNVEGARCNIP
jgi:hypothetical protein